MLQAVIFDFDDLIANTEFLHCQAYQIAGREFGFELSYDDYAEHWIRAGLGIADYVKLRELPHNPLEVRERKAAAYRTLVQSSCELMPGARRLLDRLRGHLKLAIGSSGYRVDVEAALALLDIQGYFEAISTGTDVERIKPAPDIFLHAARQLGMEPARCVVLEDAEKGILAAHAAGMLSIAVPTSRTRLNDFSKATLVVPSLDDITLDLLERLEPDWNDGV